MAHCHLDVVKILRETPEAFLCIIRKCDDVDLDDWEEWLAKSQISNPEDYKRGDKNCTITITEWLALKLEIIDQPKS